MRSGLKAIDVWDPETFDDELRDSLHGHAALISNYWTFDRREFLARETFHGWRPAEENPYAGDFLEFVEGIGGLMEDRSIRGWHFTRLAEEEVAALRKSGIYPGTLETLQARLSARVAAGDLTAADASALFRASPCHDKEQQAGRIGKFWLSCRPFPPSYDGVEPLLSSWGGEAAYFWLKDERLKQIVLGIGRPHILEVLVPMGKTRHSYQAGRAAAATVARRLGLHADHAMFDFYSKEPLGPETILAIHAEGEAGFDDVAYRYPE